MSAVYYIKYGHKAKGEGRGRGGGRRGSRGRGDMPTCFPGKQFQEMAGRMAGGVVKFELLSSDTHSKVRGFTCHVTPQQRQMIPFRSECNFQR